MPQCQQVSILACRSMSMDSSRTSMGMPSFVGTMVSGLRRLVCTYLWGFFCWHKLSEPFLKVVWCSQSCTSAQSRTDGTDQIQQQQQQHQQHDLLAQPSKAAAAGVASQCVLTQELSRHAFCMKGAATDKADTIGVFLWLSRLKGADCVCHLAGASSAQAILPEGE